MSEQQTKFKTDFNIKIDQPTLKQVLEGLESLVDECTFKIDNEGLSSIVMDVQHVALIHISMPNSIFEKYEVTRQGYFNFKIKDALKIIDDIPKEATIKILNDDKDLMLMANNTTYYLELNDQYEHFESPLLPKIHYDSKVVLEPEYFTKFITRLSKFGEYLTIECTNNTLNLVSYSTNKGKQAVIKLEKGMQELKDISSRNQNSECNYTIQYLLPYLKTIPKDTPQEIGFSSLRPLRHKVSLNNIGFIDFYLAPRVEN